LIITTGRLIFKSTGAGIWGKLSSVPAVLTFKDPPGSTMLTLYEERSSAEPIYEELKHSQVSGGYTDPRLLAILEGYSESGTQSSRDNYKYREYIEDGQTMYKITETQELL